MSGVTWTRHRERGLACLLPTCPSEPPGTLPCTDRHQAFHSVYPVYPLCTESTIIKPCWIQGNDYNQQELPVGPRYNGRIIWQTGVFSSSQILSHPHIRPGPQELAHRVSFLIETVGEIVAKSSARPVTTVTLFTSSGFSSY